MTDDERKWIAEKQAELDAMLEHDPAHYVAARRRFQQEYEERFSEQEQPNPSALRRLVDPRAGELTNVVLTAPIEHGRHKLPAGAVGTIMSVFPMTGTYTIEFFEPSCVIPAVGKDIVKPE